MHFEQKRILYSINQSISYLYVISGSNYLGDNEKSKWLAAKN